MLFVDESHQTVPQIGAMARGDHRRKITLAEYGFRLPSCIDNRPLRFNEWDAMRPQSVFVSATPGPWEMNETGGVFSEQVIRPTGLIDPPVEIKPVEDQVDDLVHRGEARPRGKGYRTLVTTLTKRMAEDLTEYLHEAGLRVRYMHSDVETLERIELIRDLRLGVYDVLVGINLLREGLDIPECGLVAILDADKEGFLRSETSLIQTIGRAARNIDGRVILYADRVTGSMERALNETDRRREKQLDYNVEHGITPASIKSHINDIMSDVTLRDGVLVDTGDDERPHLVGHNLKAYIGELEERMRKAAADLEFEEAARLRDEIRRLEEDELGIPDPDRVVPRPERKRDAGQARHAADRLREDAAPLGQQAISVQAHATQSRAVSLFSKFTRGMRRKRGAKFMFKKIQSDHWHCGDVRHDTGVAPGPKGDEPVAVPRSIKQGIDFVYVDPQMSSVARRKQKPQNWLQRLFNPSASRQGAPNPMFDELARGLQQYQATWGRLPQTKIPAGAALKRGSTGKRVALLRTRLGLPAGGGYDEPLFQAVSSYQTVHGLGPATESRAGRRSRRSIAARPIMHAASRSTWSVPFGFRRRARSTAMWWSIPVPPKPICSIATGRSTACG